MMANTYGNNWLTDEEVDALVMALARGSKRFHRNGGFTEAQGAQVVRWAEEHKITEGFFELVIKGMIDISIKDGKLQFSKCPPKPHKEIAEKD